MIVDPATRRAPLWRPRRPGWRPPPLWIPSRELWTPQNAVTVDQANIGTGGASAVSVLNITTTAAVASGAMIVMGGGRFTATSTVTLAASGGGLTWTATPSAGVTNGSYRVYLFWAFAPSGLPISSTLTITASAGCDITGGALSYLGLDTVGTAVASGTGTGAATAWSTGVVAGSAANLYCAVSAGDAGAARTSIPTSPAVERLDFFAAGSGGSMTVADKLSGNASDTVAGAWSANVTHGTVGVAFKAAGGAAATRPMQSRHLRPRTGWGVSGRYGR